MTFSLHLSFSNMADNAGRVANMARILAIGHIIVGSLIICFGIADCAMQYTDTAYIGYGIWIGVWMCIAGGLGIPGTRKERTTRRDVFAGVFMGFSIASAVFGGLIIMAYSIAIASYRDDYDNYPYYNDYGPTRDYYNDGYRRVRYNFDAEMALGVIILILGIVEFAIGIWVAVCLCMMKPCTCCYHNPPQGQVMYPPNSGYTIAQYPGGAPVAVPMQGGSGMVPVQTVTPGPQGCQPQIAMAPVSGMVGNQPQFAQMATSSAMTTSFQPQFAQVATPDAMATDNQPQAPPPYGHGGYMKLENDDSPVNT